jgi:hypothetical protein
MSRTCSTRSLFESAIRRASRASVVCMCRASCQPTTLRLHTSITKLKNTMPSPATQIADVGYPELVGVLSGEIAVHEVWPSASLGVRGRGPPRLAAVLGSVDAVGAHQLLHLATRCPLARTRERLPGPPVVVCTVVRLVHPGLGRWAGPEAFTMLLHVRAHFVRSGSSSWAKDTLADFKAPLARRSSKFSRRSLRIYSRSWVVSRSRRSPVSA